MRLRFCSRSTAKKVRKLGETEVGTLAEGIAFSPDGQFVVQLQDHLRSLVEPKIAEHRGRVVKTGGGVLLEFPFYRPDSDDRATRFRLTANFLSSATCPRATPWDMIECWV